MSIATPTGETTPDTARAMPRGSVMTGLSSRLLALTILFVFIVEFVIFIPSAANYRANWIETRVEQARIAVLALDALLLRAEVVAVGEIADGMRTQLLSQSTLPDAMALEVTTASIRSLPAIGDTIGALFGDQDRWMLIVDPDRTQDHLEILVPIAPLKDGLADFAWRIVGLSLIIAVAVGALIFLSLYWLVVRPILRVTASVEQFRDNPRDWTRRLASTPRSDEIGRAQNALADLEVAVQNAFRQRERLAQLGEAMSKINHDLRNSLAAAQLVSDSLSRSDDPRVQRAAPRLERTLERAIGLAQATLNFSKGEPVETHLQTVDLRAAIEEAALEGLAGHDAVSFTCSVGDHAVRLDPDHFHRILVNLTRNAAQAMARAASPAPAITVSEDTSDGALALLIADTGPGIPPKVRDKLFQAFSGAGSRDGTGLGLAIAKELAEAMGAELTLAETGADGTVFRLGLGLG